MSSICDCKLFYIVFVFFLVIMKMFLFEKEFFYVSVIVIDYISVELVLNIVEIKGL